MSYVPATGPRDAKIILVGEAPGAEEARIGQPFVGESGKLMTKLLLSAGILREQMYITNVVKERPPRNDIKAFIDLSKKVPKVSEQGEHYLRLLNQELSRLRPNVIIAAGNTALWALTGNKGILKWRGSVLAVNGRKIIPTIHPASVLRGSYLQRHYILFDLQRAKRESSSPDLPTDSRRYILRPSFDACCEYLAACKAASLVSFDIEVSQGEVSCISFSHDPSHAISIPFIQNGREYFTLPQEAAIWRLICSVLEDESIPKVAHNTTFDATFLYRKYGIRSRNLHDTMVAQGILYPDFPKSLAFVTTQYTLIPYYKDDGRDAARTSVGQDNEAFWLYNAKDAIVLMEALPRQLEELTQQGNLATYNSQRELIEPLLYMTELGMRLDVEKMHRNSDRLSDEIQKLEQRIQDAAGYALNPRSTKQLMEYFYEILGLPPYIHPKTKKPTTDEKALKRISRKGVQAAALILEQRRLLKLKSTYLDMQLDEDNRLRSSMNPIGTVTLRLSSSKTIFKTGGNVQNLPPAMKVNILPDPGHLVVEMDLSQAENRIVAYIAPDYRMIEAYEQGIDLHCQTASLMFGKDRDEIAILDKQWEDAGKPIGDPILCAPIGQADKPWRYWGKQANFSLNYGLHWKSASLKWEIPENDGKYIYEMYHKAYPGVQQMQRWIKEMLNKDRTVENLFGFRRRFLGAWDDIQLDAYAFPAQSTVGEILNRRGIKFVYYRTDLFPHLRLLNQIHDSIVFEVPLSAGFEEISSYVTLIKSSLEQPLSFRGRSFTIPVETKIFPRNLRDGYELHDLSPTGIEATYRSSRRKK